MKFYRPSDFTPRFVLDNVYLLDFSNPAVIKAAVMKYGAVQCSIYAGYYADDETVKSYFYSSEATSISHCVAIVGWDDDYSKDNFVGVKDGEVPKCNGAWLIRDSYGSGPGSAHGDGYFYISYEEGSLAYPAVFMLARRPLPESTSTSTTRSAASAIWGPIRRRPGGPTYSLRSAANR